MSVMLNTYSMFTEEELKTMFTNEKGELNVYGYNTAKAQTQDQFSTMGNFVKTGESAIFFVSPMVYEELNLKKLAQPLSKLYDSTPANAYDEYSVYLKDTAFYQYFEGKDALLGTLAALFDEKYEELIPTLEDIPDSFGKLVYLNTKLFQMIENSISIELLSNLLGTQLFAKGEKHLLDRSRTYFKLLLRIVKSGQERGEIRTDLSANEIVKAYALLERAFMYDWCLCSGEYSLVSFSAPLMQSFLATYKNNI